MTTWARNLYDFRASLPAPGEGVAWPADIVIGPNGRALRVLDDDVLQAHARDPRAAVLAAVYTVLQRYRSGRGPDPWTGFDCQGDATFGALVAQVAAHVACRGQASCSQQRESSLRVVVLRGEQTDFAAGPADDAALTVKIGAGGEVLLEVGSDCIACTGVLTAQILFMEHVARALMAGCRCSGNAFASLELLSDEEIARLDVVGSGPRIPYAPTHTVLDLWRNRVATTPDAIALRTDGVSSSGDRGTWTFARIDTLSDRLAGLLRTDFAVDTDQAVAVILESSPELIVSALAILKAGGAYMPIDPSYPTARIEAMLKDAHVRVTLVNRETAAMAPSWAQAHLIHKDLDALPALAAALPAPLPHHLVYLIFTSGSTGRPKGILQTHRCLFNFMNWQVFDAGFEPGLRVLQCAALGFDVSVQELFFSLLSGATLFLTDGALRHDLQRLIRFAIEHDIEMVDLPFSIINVLTQLTPSLGDADALRHLVSAGEPLQLTPFLVALLRRRPRLSIHNHYGPAENHMLTSHTVSAQLGGLEPRPPLGRLIRNTRAWVLDEHQQRIPFGVVGEIYIAGDGLARGYVDAERTRAQFVPNRVDGGARCYKTGDLGQWRSDGTLQILGRLDDQVKIRGFRIELSEVEHALRECADIEEAAAIVHDNAAGLRELVAYVVASGPVDTTRLRLELGKMVPSYLVPSRIIALDVLPISPNGKLDRAALPRPSPASARELAACPVEREWTRIWCAVLGRDDIARDDNLVDLGLDSMSAALGLTRAATAFGMPIPLRELYAEPTIAALASTVRQRGAHASALESEPSLQERSEASEAQWGVWLVDRRDDAGHRLWNFSEAWRIRETLDPALLGKSLQSLAARHSALRTSFIEIDGKLFQQIASEVAIPFSVVDLRARPQEAWRDASRTLLHEPFDLERGPLLRACLYVGPEASVYVLAFHHIIADNWSMTVLIRDLTALCRGVELLCDREDWSYPQYASWQRRWLSGPEGEQMKTWWREHLVPTAQYDPAGNAQLAATRTFDGSVWSFTLDAATTSSIGRLATQRRTSAFVVLLAAFAMLLHRYLGREDLTIGTTFAGRAAPHLADTVGLLANALPLRIDVASDDTFEEVLERARDEVFAVEARQMVPATLLAAGLEHAGSARRDALFEVGFQVLPAPGQQESRGALFEWIETGWAPGARNDVWFAGQLHGAVITFRIEYRRDVWSEAFIARWAQRFVAVVETIMRDPAVSCGALIPEQALDISLGEPLPFEL